MLERKKIENVFEERMFQVFCIFREGFFSVPRRDFVSSTRNKKKENKKKKKNLEMETTKETS